MSKQVRVALLHSSKAGEKYHDVSNLLIFNAVASVNLLECIPQYWNSSVSATPARNLFLVHLPTLGTWTFIGNLFKVCWHVISAEMTLYLY